MRSDHDAAQVPDLAWEFVGWLRDRYPERNQQIDDYLRRQNFEVQIADPVRYFTPPRGECLLARLRAHPVGILMLKPHGPGVCEMNRMYVRPEARGHGIGRALVARLIERARDLGYDRMVLGALNRHHEAQPLYLNMGFNIYRPDDAPPNDNVVHMRRDL